ncbi:hypothetical protein SABIM44S_00844 [Streptomyces abikoensis]
MNSYGLFGRVFLVRLSYETYVRPHGAAARPHRSRHSPNPPQKRDRRSRVGGGSRSLPPRTTPGPGHGHRVRGAGPLQGRTGVGRRGHLCLLPHPRPGHNRARHRPRLRRGPEGHLRRRHRHRRRRQAFRRRGTHVEPPGSGRRGARRHPRQPRTRRRPAQRPDHAPHHGQQRPPGRGQLRRAVRPHAPRAAQRRRRGALVGAGGRDAGAAPARLELLVRHRPRPRHPARARPAPRPPGRRPQRREPRRQAGPRQPRGARPQR